MATMDSTLSTIPFMESDGVILAGAGAGKTTATVSLHASAVDRGARALIITFTNATVNDYINRANSVRAGLASKECVYTFHKLAAHILQGASRPDNENVSLDTVVALALESVKQSGLKEELRDVRVILVDESQDCSRENYELVRAIAYVTGATVIMIGDANQSLYRFRNASPKFLLDHAKGGFNHALTTNWRSSPEIVSLTNQFMRHPITVSPRPGAASGPVPRLLLRDPRKIAREVVDLARAALGRGMSVMVVGRSKRPRFEKGVLIRVGLQMIVNEMSARGTAYARMFREANDDDGGDAAACKLTLDAVNVLTIHGSKGLESDTVIVIDAIDERTDGEVGADQMELMYVAFSRARTELVVINSRHAQADTGLQHAIREGLCTADGDVPTDACALDRQSRDAYSVTQLLTDRTLLGESELLDFSRELSIESHRISWPSDAEGAADLPDIADLRTLYGTLAENCVQMVYNSQQSSEPPPACVIDRLTTYATRRISVPAIHSRSLSSLYTITGARRSDPISRSEVTSLRRRLERQAGAYSRTIDLLDYILTAMSKLNIDSAVLTLPSSTQKVPIHELRKLITDYNLATSNEDRVPFLFAACMFFYQLDHHAGYRWGRNYSAHIKAFSPFFHRISQMAKDLPEDCVFERNVHFRHLRLSGRTDASSPGRIVEFKFTGQLGMTHFMQPCVYAILDGERFAKRCEVWNLATGEKVFVKYDNGPLNRWRVFQRLATVTGKTVTVDDIKRTDTAMGGIRLKSDKLRAMCDIESEDMIAAALAFVTSGEACVRGTGEDTHKA